MALSERKKQILKAVVDDFVQTAEPVGSKAVVTRLNMSVSSATIRNEMAELERLGYLEQPHTSAGRVPSSLGYRLYVDELMQGYRLTGTEIAQMSKMMSFRVRELDRLIAEAGKMVSEMTCQPAFAVSPASESEQIRRFEVIMVNPSTVVLVLVTTSDMIKNRICHLSFPLSNMEIAAANRALNAHFTNIPLDDMTGERISAAEFESGQDITELLIAAIDFAADVIRAILDREVYLQGSSQILKNPEFHDLDKARMLLDHISDRDVMTRLPAPEKGKKVRIVIGKETGDEALEDASIVLTSYETGGGATGLLGVVGPTRMDYARIAAHLTRFSKHLSDYLKENGG